MRRPIAVYVGSVFNQADVFHGFPECVKVNM